MSRASNMDQESLIFPRRKSMHQELKKTFNQLTTLINQQNAAHSLKYCSTTNTAEHT